MNTRQQSRWQDAVPEVYRFGVAAYHRIIAANIFTEDEHIELINGELRLMPPINADHAGKNKRLNRLFSRLVQDRAIIAVQDPLTLPENSEPEPDLMLLRPRDNFYEQTHPTPEDTLLVVEIADTSLRYDRTIKVPLYAAHGIPELWLLNLKNRSLEIYRDPGPNGYRQLLLPERDTTIALLLLPEVHIHVAELWL